MDAIVQSTFERHLQRNVEILQNSLSGRSGDPAILHDVLSRHCIEKRTNRRKMECVAMLRCSSLSLAEAPAAASWAKGRTTLVNEFKCYLIQTQTGRIIIF
jgi:hypothetical protein